MNEEEELVQQLLDTIRSLHWKVNILVALIMCLAMICYIIIYGLKVKRIMLPPH